ncbi:hypothetical protein GB931_06200 [Modestobacter sp. I12A-02628]|uniref:DUF4878 domain-containing protein n=1 Tax=Goekera deserti TaxID=2497753 RepID=A0A7K3WB84_9ACTN|nr:hypothetical protein [Goekera deserti]MPQ97520.1 hypothetical protein [Goekera deserti]NDI47876.1 hypothetical protein [Goekera deserti]NEL53624.1 hypothetical protein [Goekera deserti]
MSSPDYLYDDDPAPLHTGTPRGRNRWIVAALLGTGLVALLAAYLLPVVNGSATEQSEQAAGVFVSALSQGDVGTAYSLLCDAERARLEEVQLNAEYLQPGTPRVVGSTELDTDDPTVEVQVEWTDGGATTRTTLTMVPQSGAKVCGVAVG